MRITVTIAGAEHVCTVPYPSAQFVVVEGRTTCPHCAGWPAVVDQGRGKVVAVARSEAGLRAALAEYPQGRAQLPAQRPEWMLPQPAVGAQYLLAPNALHLRLPQYTDDDRVYTGDAVCCRCGLGVGPMVVDPGTLFGIEEDRAVTAGRYRVY